MVFPIILIFESRSSLSQTSPVSTPGENMSRVLHISPPSLHSALDHCIFMHILPLLHDRLPSHHLDIAIK